MTGRDMMMFTVTDPYAGDRFWVTEEERTAALDKYALKSQHEPTKELATVADTWWLAYWQAVKRGDEEGWG